MLDMPYFMNNDKWFWYDASAGKFVLTEEAPPKAQESYIEFYNNAKV